MDDTKIFLSDYRPVEATADEVIKTASRGFAPTQENLRVAQTTRGKGGSKNERTKTHPFQLGKDGSNTTIQLGRLIASVNSIEFEDVDDASKYIQQTGVGLPTAHVPEVFDGVDDGLAELNWRGNVYLYWETDEDGTVTACDIKGPDEPEHIPLPLADSSEESGAGAKFWVLVGVVPSDSGDIEQHLTSDFCWYGAFVKQGEESSSSSSESSASSEESSSEASSSEESSAKSDGSSSGSSGEGESSAGSDKSTAIVPAPWSPTGYAALFTLEAPDVRFEDVIEDVTITGRETVVPIDPRFVAVCEPNSLRVVGCTGDKPYAVGATVAGCDIHLMAMADARRRPSIVQLKISGIRKGFAGKRFSERTHTQFIANEKFINSAYPKA